MKSSLSSNICDQNVNFFSKILCRSEMKATRSPTETAKYVIKAKLVSSLWDTILANFGLFGRQQNGFWFVYSKFLLPFHYKHILSYKKMQKKFRFMYTLRPETFTAWPFYLLQLWEVIFALCISKWVSMSTCKSVEF